MTKRMVVLAVLVAACGGKDPPVSSTSTTPPAPKPVETAAATPAPAAFPALETACATDADCTTTGRWSTCCGVCEQKYASKAYVAKVDAFCTANPPEQCPPMGCSWGMATVHCVEGVCRDQPQTPPKIRVKQPLPSK